MGATAGMMVGQVYAPLPPAGSGRTGQIGDPVGAVRDRSGNPLVFSRRASLTFNNEATGIRFNKYPMNPASMNDGAWGTENEFPFLRFSDVRLMKAEAILRGGTDAETPLAIVNGIRARRRVGNLASVTLTNLLAERGRELYLEGHRRTDLIRFGQFTAPVEERPSASSDAKVVFPIPTVSLSSNPNLKQNFGY
ncbi:MAG: RagB/SusD family nutrient uptake outer membrane protein [Chitinophagia bacterium]|nr:RagB/SusD family nutrient uptake outer membrane protein [Chitinophagia bacterium]